MTWSQFDADGKAVLLSPVAQRTEMAQQLVELLGIDGQVKVMMVPCLARVRRRPLPTAPRHTLAAPGRRDWQQVGYIAGFLGESLPADLGITCFCADGPTAVEPWSDYLALPLVRLQFGGCDHRAYPSRSTKTR